MVKKNGSLAGRGLEILFGEKPVSEVEPVEESSEQPAAPLTEVEGNEMSAEDIETTEEPLEFDWLANLEAEATAVDTVSVGDEAAASGDLVDLSMLDVDNEDRPMASEPDEEMMLLATTPIDDALDAEIPSVDLTAAPFGGQGEALSSQPTSAKPVTIKPVVAQPITDLTPMSGSVATMPSFTSGSTYVPPISESMAVGGAPAPVPQPKDKTESWSTLAQAKLGEPLFSSAPRTTVEDLEQVGVGLGKFDASEPEDYEKDQPSHVRDESEVIDAVPPRERSDLWEEINLLYGQVAETLATHDDQKTALRLLQQAQDILLEKPRQYDMALYKVGQVRTMLQRRKMVVSSSRSIAWIIFFYDILWIVALGYMLLFLTFDLPNVQMESLLITILWGSIGGVMGGFYGLYRHVSQYQDFDKQYSMWYIAQPVIGALLGAVVHLIMNAGFLPTSVEGTDAMLNFMHHLVAFIGGFRQRFVLDLIARVIDALSPEREKADTSEDENPSS